MGTSFRIQGVTVNHQTSHFVELMLRSLFGRNDLSGIDFQMTVLDNRSDDGHLELLKAYLATRNISLVQTGFDAGVAVEKHGAALAEFVRRRDDCTHYLFLDCDIWFEEPETIPTMVEELAGAPASTFANQARIIGYYAGRVIEGRDGIPGAGDTESWPTWETWHNDRPYTTSGTSRCSPVCSLVANTPLFRAVVEAFGLSPALRFGVGEAVYYDTFGLMTHVMAAYGHSFIVSSKAVNHFTETVHRPDLRAPKDRDCLRMLDELRAAG